MRATKEYKTGDFVCSFEQAGDINDFSCIEMPDSLRNSKGLFKISNPAVCEHIDKYVNLSCSMANVHAKNGFIYAKRPIRKGEEIYAHYGFAFWINALIEKSTDFTLILFGVLITDAIKIDRCGQKITFEGQTIEPNELFYLLAGADLDYFKYWIGDTKGKTDFEIFMMSVDLIL